MKKIRENEKIETNRAEMAPENVSSVKIYSPSLPLNCSLVLLFERNPSGADRHCNPIT